MNKVLLKIFYQEKQMKNCLLSARSGPRDQSPELDPDGDRRETNHGLRTLHTRWSCAFKVRRHNLFVLEHKISQETPTLRLHEY